MPFTPFHLGPALLVKSAAPRHFSFSAFAISQVAIDCETLYWRSRHQWHVHRVLHTFVGGAIVGTVLAVAFSLLVWPSFLRIRRLVNNNANNAHNAHNDRLAAEARLGPAIAGGLLGGLSHSLLDGIVHWDIRPFGPFSMENPFLGLLDERLLYVLCTAMGALGVTLLLRGQSRTNDRQQGK
jgi:hypothetical protein